MVASGSFPDGGIVPADALAKIRSPRAMTFSPPLRFGDCEPPWQLGVAQFVLTIDSISSLREIPERISTVCVVEQPLLSVTVTS